MSIYITDNNGSLTMNGSTKAVIKSSIQIVGSGTELPITTEGDFKDIPPHLHQVYLRSMLSSYEGSVNVYDNTEPKIIETQKSKWGLNKIVDIINKVISKK